MYIDHDLSPVCDLDLCISQVKDVLKDVMADLQQTNLEKTLLSWCRQSTQGYVLILTSTIILGLGEVKMLIYL